jgi:hypothetical protein
MIKENMRRNINMILTISIAGYDVGGRDGEYLSVLNDNYMQKQIRGYV